jgi:hypothetical protein
MSTAPSPLRDGKPAKLAQKLRQNPAAKLKRYICRRIINNPNPYFWQPKMDDSASETEVALAHVVDLDSISLMSGETLSNPQPSLPFPMISLDAPGGSSEPATPGMIPTNMISLPATPPLLIIASPRSTLMHTAKHDLVLSRMIENLETAMLPVFGEDLKKIPNWNGRVGEPNDFDGWSFCTVRFALTSIFPGSKFYVDTMTKQLGFSTIKKCKPENNKLILLCERFGESHSRRYIACAPLERGH